MVSWTISALRKISLKNKTPKKGFLNFFIWVYNGGSNVFPPPPYADVSSVKKICVSLFLKAVFEMVGVDDETRKMP